MKNIITLIIALLIVVSTFAQQGFNYKALIKDDLGNALSSQNIHIRFTIFSIGSPVISNYQEIHNTSTDINGIAIVTIGEGTSIIGTFPEDSWSPNIFLKVEIDTDLNGTYVDFGETSFKKVPMAIAADRAEYSETAGYATVAHIANFVDNAFSGDYNDLINKPEGLEKITENGNTGWKLNDYIIDQHGPIGVRGVDLSRSVNGGSPDAGATGPLSISLGVNSSASGNNSTAIGYYTKAVGLFSTAIGIYNIGLGAPSAFNSDTDPLLEVGNGTDNENRNNALTIYGNGNAKFDAEIQHTTTGDANLIPIAYGTIESDGNVRSGTGNFTASLYAGVLSISVNGQTMTVDNSSCLITPYSTAFRTSSLIMSGGDIQVRIFDSSGNLNPTTFQFTIYKL